MGEGLKVLLFIFVYGLFKNFINISFRNCFFFDSFDIVRKEIVDVIEYKNIIYWKYFKK